MQMSSPTIFQKKKTMWKNKEKEKQNSLYLIYKKKSVTKLNLYCDSIFIRFEIKKYMQSQFAKYNCILKL